MWKNGVAALTNHVIDARPSTAPLICGLMVYDLGIEPAGG
jgi:hypothetical protein